MQVADGIHLLTQGVVNFYLVEDGGKLTLVDAGAPGDWGTFERAVGSLGRTLADLDAVLLTHAHSDHTGFAERARTQAEAAVWIHGADAEAARTGAAPKNEAGFGKYLFRLEAYRTLFGLMRRKGLKIVPIHEVSTFGDGEILDVPGRPRVVHVPGHTEGSCAILLEPQRALITGDALATRNPLTGRTGPQIGPGRPEPRLGAGAPFARRARDDARRPRPAGPRRARGRTVSPRRFAWRRWQVDRR